jgi:cation diffusion facilitator CzcD-associated flavoprotein CzcO
VGLSDDYYDALVRENVSLVASPVTRVTESGVVDNDGNVHEVDVIIWATGAFNVNELSQVPPAISHEIAPHTIAMLPRYPEG